MRALWCGELVHVASLKQGAFPVEFTWRGQRHRVRSIDHYRTDTQRHRDGVITCRLFRLRTENGMRCLLSQDAVRGIWHMEQVLVGRGDAR